MSRVSISMSGTPLAMIWFAASTSASLADGWTATKSKPCDEIVCRSCSCFSTLNSPSNEVTSTPSRSPKNLAVSIPCETQVEPAPTSEVAAVYCFSGRSSGRSPSEASPCAAVTWRPTPVAMASAPGGAIPLLNASRRLKPFFKRSPTNSSSSPASGPRFATSPIDATSTWTDRHPCRRPPPAIVVPLPRETVPDHDSGTAWGTSGQKGARAQLEADQLRLAAREHVTDPVLAAPSWRASALPRSLVACAGRYHTVRTPSTTFALTPVTPKHRQDIGRDPLHDRELLLVRGFHQELAHAGLAVSADDVGEGVGRGPGVRTHRDRPAVERADDLVRVAASRHARLVEAVVALPDLFDRAVRIPAIGIAGGDPQHPRPVRTEGDRWSRTLQWGGAERGVVDLVVLALPRGDVPSQQRIDQHDRLLEAPDQLRGLREGHAEPLMLGPVPAGADAELQPATRDVIDRHRLLGEQRRGPGGGAAFPDFAA